MTLEQIATIATIIGTVVAIIGMVLSSDFRNFIKRVIKTSAFWKFVGMATIFFIGIALGTTLREIFPKESILKQVMQRKYLNCGVEGSLSAFSFMAKGTEFPKGAQHPDFYRDASGFDADFCKVVAVAIFGDQYNNDSVHYVPLTTSERFEAIEQGRIDVLFRNTTWTVGRDLKYKITFGPTIFYDGQGFLVDEHSSIKTIEDINGKTICVQAGTTTIDNLNSEFRKRNIYPLEIRDKAQSGNPFVTNEDFIAEFNLNRCEVVTADKSQLATLQKDMNRGVILKDTISKEPLTPAYISGDSSWADVVDYSVYATIYAAEMGMNKGNLSDWERSNNLEAYQFLGVDDPQIEKNSAYIGEKLGLKRNFAKLIIDKVGNYDDIYSKNFKDLAALVTDRGLNQMYSKGGILYSPPFSYPQN